MKVGGGGLYVHSRMGKGGLYEHSRMGNGGLYEYVHARMGKRGRGCTCILGCESGRSASAFYYEKGGLFVHSRMGRGGWLTDIRQLIYNNFYSSPICIGMCVPL
jgi:hypothetical protein